MKKVVLVGAIALFGLAACKKEETAKPVTPIVAEDTRDQMVGEYSLTMINKYKYSSVSSKSDEINENKGTLIISKNLTNTVGLDAKIKIGSDEITLNISSIISINNSIYLTIPNQTIFGDIVTGSKSYQSTSSQFDGIYSSTNKYVEFILLSEYEEDIDGSTVTVPVEIKFSATKN
jgi:uncharacterized lipoprotein YajG